MKKNPVIDFLASVERDPELKQQLENAMKRGVDTVVELGAEAGFQFTSDEFVAEVRAKMVPASSESDLGEIDLEQVAGGASAPLSSGIYIYKSWGG